MNSRLDGHSRTIVGVLVARRVWPCRNSQPVTGANAIAEYATEVAVPGL